MGLSIRYELRSDARRACKVQRLIEGLRLQAMDIRHFWVRQVADWQGAECEPAAHRTRRWKRLAEQATRYVEHEGRRIPVRPERMIGFPLCIGEGLEHAGFALATYPESVIDPETELVLPTGLDGWSWKASYETQPAGDKSAARFLYCHITLVAILDSADELGIVASVEDDGGYWETRDVEGLKTSFREWEQIVVGRVKRRA